MSAALEYSDEISFAWSHDYDRFLTEAWPMIQPHWKEVGSHRDVLKLNPNHDAYRRLTSLNMLHILTARVGARLIGYLFIIIMPHPRDMDAMLARDDIFYVMPQYRRLRMGPKMIEQVLSYVDGKADLIFLTEKLRRRAKGLAASDIGDGYLARYGFHPSEMIWSKRLPPRDRA